MLDEVASSIGNTMHIGKVDATIETKLAKQYNIKSYPSIFYSKSELGATSSPVLKEYKGGRDKGSLVLFAHRMSRDAVQVLSDDKTLMKHLQDITKAQDAPAVVFILCHNDDQDDHHFVKSFLDTATDLQADIDSFSSTSSTVCAIDTEDRVLELPYIIRHEEEGPRSVYEPTTDNNLHSWLLQNKWPTVVELGSHNYMPLTSSGKLLIIAILDMNKKRELKESLAELKKLSSSQTSPLPAYKVPLVQFCYMDG